MGGTITAITQALGHGGEFGTLEPYLLGRNLDIATLAYKTIIDTVGDINKLPHHKQVLFTFPNVPEPSFLTKEIRIVKESLLRSGVAIRGDEGGEGNEESSDDHEGEGEEKRNDA